MRKSSLLDIRSRKIGFLDSFFFSLGATMMMAGTHESLFEDGSLGLSSSISRRITLVEAE